MSIDLFSLRLDHRRPKLSVRESQQKYKELFENPDKRPEKIILQEIRN